MCSYCCGCCYRVYSSLKPSPHRASLGIHVVLLLHVPPKRWRLNSTFAALLLPHLLIYLNRSFLDSVPAAEDIWRYMHCICCTCKSASITRIHNQPYGARDMDSTLGKLFDSTGILALCTWYASVGWFRSQYIFEDANTCVNILPSKKSLAHVDVDLLKAPAWSHLHGIHVMYCSFGPNVLHSFFIRHWHMRPQLGRPIWYGPPVRQPAQL